MAGRICSIVVCLLALDLVVGFADLNDFMKTISTLQKQVDSLQKTVEKMSSKPTVKQFTWKALNDDRDSGPIHSVTYKKRNDNSAIRISWNGDIGVKTDTANHPYGSCNRWYFTFNAVECVHPDPIEMQYYVQNTENNPHVPSSGRYLKGGVVEGVCSNIKAGPVNITLHVGRCNIVNHVELGDAYTGWHSTTRLLVDEVTLEN